MGLNREVVINKAKEMVKLAEENGIPLRIIGATAIYIHSPNHAYIHESLKREISDVDFISYRKYWKKIKELFKNQNWDEPAAYMMAVADRNIFVSKEYEGLHSDVFYDKLSFCHDIPFEGRLEKDYPTIPLAELLLEKMQIVKINEKDIIDTIVLLAEHDIGQSDKETINIEIITKLLAKDWGFYYTVTTNLKKVDEFLVTYNIPEEDKKHVKDRISRLLAAIEEEPKTMAWKIRAKVGPSKKWYRDYIEEVSRPVTGYKYEEV